MAVTIFYKDGSHSDYNTDKITYIPSIRFAELSKGDKVVVTINLDTVEAIEDMSAMED